MFYKCGSCLIVISHVFDDSLTPTDGTTMEKIDLETGEILNIGPGGLYAPLPIPAYKALGAAGEHHAQVVLTCLVSHMGKNNFKVFPSYEQIRKLTGKSRSTIASAIRTLKDYGFIHVKTIQIRQNRKRNMYYISKACYDITLFNNEAKGTLVYLGRCKCGASVTRADIGSGSKNLIHYGCGEQVYLKTGVEIPLYEPEVVAHAPEMELTSSISSEPRLKGEREN